MLIIFEKEKSTSKARCRLFGTGLAEDNPVSLTI